MNDWSLQDAAHLLRRAGFGGSYEQLLQLHAMGRDAAIDHMINYTGVPDPAANESYNLGLDFSTSGGVVGWLLYRMMHTTRPLQEKLTWFWHGHFTSALSKCPPQRMLIQNETWRSHANGFFLDFLKAMYKDPAMLIYLDGKDSVSGNANENFARELFELFTLGIGHYSEEDVKEAARALTGWTIEQFSVTEGFFRWRRHDKRLKTIFGETGRWDGDDLMVIVVGRNRTAEFVCSQMFRFFVHPEPTDAELAPMLAAWQQSGGHLGTVVEAMLRSDAFWSAQARNALVKSPIEYLIGSLQRLEVDVATLSGLGTVLQQMGQVPLNPPNVAGYPEHLGWSGSSQLFARYNGLLHLLYRPESDGILARLIGDADVGTAPELVDLLADRSGPTDITSATRDSLIAYVEHGGYSGLANEIAVKGRGVIRLLGSAPEFQLN